MSQNKELQADDQTACRCLSVVMPAYNEEATLAAIVKRVVGIPHLLELIIIDDCSSDKTGDVALRLSATYPIVQYVRHDRNKGKTEALKTGFAMVKGDVVIVQDADLEYDPNEIQDVINPIIQGHADVVYGSRFMVKKATRILYFTHYIANKSLTFFSNCFTNLNMSDMETCYKAFRTEIAKNMIITSSGFGFEVEVTAKIAKLKAAVYEVPISYYGRTYDQGKKIGFRDGVAALMYILKYNLFVSKKRSFRSAFELTSRITPPYLTSGGANE